MKFSKEELQEMAEILTEAETFKPIVRVILDAIKLYGPEIEEIPKRFSQWMVDNRIESIQRYRDAGFTKQEAIMMTLDDSSRLIKSVNDMNKNIKSAVNK